MYHLQSTLHSYLPPWPVVASKLVLIFPNMPGLTPVRSSANILIVHHDSAADFLSATFPTLRRHEESASIVFAHALKFLGSEAALTGCHFTNEADVSSWWRQRARAAQNPAARHKAKSNEPFWLTLWSSPSP